MIGMAEGECRSDRTLVGGGDGVVGLTLQSLDAPADPKRMGMRVILLQTSGARCCLVDSRVQYLGRGCTVWVGRRL